MSRLFAFGCSFTSYKWPTWADMLGQEFDEYQNWGRNGGGTQYIFHSLIEANQRNKFTGDDTVVIMWTTLDREDRYLRGEWFTHGSIYHNHFFPKEFVKKFADDRWGVLRDLTLISAAKDLLDHWGVKYHFLKIMPFEFLLEGCVEPVQDIMIEFAPLLATIKPSMFETVMRNSLNHNFTQEEYQVFAGADWPSYDEFVKGSNGIVPSVISEVKHFRTQYLPPLTIEGYRKLNPEKIERDPHPYPKQHLDYLDLVLPQYKLSRLTRDWAIDAHKKIVANIKGNEVKFPELFKSKPNIRF